MNLAIIILTMQLVPLYIYSKFWSNETTISKTTRNDMLAFAYLIINLGPNVSAFSVVQFLISSNEEDKLTLILVFIAGIILYYIGRKLRDFIHYLTVNKITKPKKQSLSSLAQNNSKN